MKRGFSASTAILVALLLGILVWVGKVVNPPAAKGHDHSDEETSQTASAQSSGAKATAKEPVDSKLNRKEEMQKHMAEQQKQEAMMKAQAKTMQAASAKSAGSGGAKKAHTAPDGMEPSLWQERDMGPVSAAPDAKK